MTKDKSQELVDAYLLEAKELAEKFTNHLLAADTIAFYNFLEKEYVGEEAELITAEGEIIKGENLMPWYHDFFGSIFENFNIEGGFFDEKFIASGNMVVHRYSYKMSLIPKEDGDTIIEIGHGIKIYQRSAAGTWKMLYDVWSNPE